MHQPIRDNLEDYLKGSIQQVPQAFHAHLVACEECASELRLLETQANMLRSLRSVEGVVPIPGFYARVMERVRTGADPSVALRDERVAVLASNPASWVADVILFE